MSEKNDPNNQLEQFSNQFLSPEIVMAIIEPVALERGFLLSDEEKQALIKFIESERASLILSLQISKERSEIIQDLAEEIGVYFDLMADQFSSAGNSLQ